MAEIPCPFAEDVRAWGERMNPNTRLQNIRVNYGSDLCPMGIPAELLGQDEPMEQGLDEASALRLELEALRVEHAKVLVERDAFREALADRSRRR